MNKSPTKLTTLRTAAEVRLAGIPAAASQVFANEKLLHELQVHQIELEMQNDELRRTQVALEESRDDYVDLYEFAPVGYLTLTPDGLIAKINQTASNLLGGERRKLLSRHFAKQVTPEDGDKWHLFFRNVMKCKQPLNIELMLKGSNGTGFPVHLDCLCIDLMLRITLSDITQIKQAEADLHEAKTKALIDAELAIVQEIALNRLEKIASQLPGMVFQLCLHVDGSFHFPYASAAILAMYRLRPEDIREDAVKLWSRIHPEDCRGVIASLQNSARNLSPFTHEYRVKVDDGIRWLFGNAMPERNADGSTLWHGFMTDITLRKQAEEKTLLAASVFSHAREGIMITDPDGTIIDVNNALVQITGYSRSEVLGCRPRIFKSGLHDQPFYAKLWGNLLEQGNWCGEICDRRKNGEVYPEALNISAVCDNQGNTLHYIALFTDITSIKEYEKRLENIAYYDVLTELPNRVLLADRLHQAMTGRREQQLTLIFLDLDGFKAVNDQHGHDIGDQLLKVVASRMKQVLRAGDTLARLGGDEFVAVLLDLADLEASKLMLNRLLAAAAQPVHIGDLLLRVSASIGVTFYPQLENMDADQLLRQADQAMYQAKASGRNCYHVFETRPEATVCSQDTKRQRSSPTCINSAAVTVNRLALLAFAYFLAGRLGLEFAIAGSNITLLWLPTGIAVAALFRWGLRYWPAVWLGALAVNLVVNPTVWLALGISVGNTLGPVLTVMLLQHWQFNYAITRWRDVPVIVAGSALGLMACATGGILTLAVVGLVPWSDAGFDWLLWWLGDVVGVIVGGMALITFNYNQLLRQLRSSRYEFLVLAVILAGLGLAWIVMPAHHLAYIVLIPLQVLVLVWIALRLGTWPAATAALTLSACAAWALVMGNGPFLDLSLHLAIAKLWAYMATLSVVALQVSALIAERKAVEQDFKKESEKNLALLRNASDGIYILDTEGNVVEHSDSFCAMLGYRREEMSTMNVTQWNAQFDAAECLRIVRQEFTKKTRSQFETCHRCKDGAIIDVEISSFVLELDGKPVLFNCSRDITVRKASEKLLRKLSLTVEQSPNAVLITDLETNIEYVNESFVRITGYRRDEVLGKNPRLLKSEIHDANFYAALWQSLLSTGAWQGEIWNRRKDGEVYPEHLSITTLTDKLGQASNYLASFFDLSSARKSEEVIHNLAFYNPLTGLPNRRLLIERLQLAMDSSARQFNHGALLFIDLDNFKQLNDIRGHDIGDLMLIEVGKRLQGCAGHIDTLACLGGDDFVIILEELSVEINQAATQAKNIGEKIRKVINQPFDLRGVQYYISASIGISLFRDNEVSVDYLLKYADTAMYQAKQSGRNTIRFFDPDTHAAMEARIALETDLRLALPNKQFQLYYQMQVDHSETILGAEVLIRWHHPERGLVSPLQFIPLAEASGLIVPIGLWVLETACAQLKRWEQDEHTRYLQLAVNVSALQFRQPDFVTQVCTVLEKYAIKPERLKLELTESLVLDNVEDTIVKMKTLKIIGVYFSMDDFGTGYSSLAYLTQLPLDQLKIDQSFVRNIGVKPTDAVIIQTIIGMANNLGMDVIAEGVETKAQRAFLELHGCFSIQGYLVSKPVPIEQFELLLRNAHKIKLPTKH